MGENYIQKARVRSVLYKTERDKQRLEKAVSYRVKRDLELLEKIKEDLSIIYTLDEYKICKHISRLRNLIYKSNLSNVSDSFTLSGKFSIESKTSFGNCGLNPLA